MAGQGRCKKAGCGKRIWWGTNPHTGQGSYPFDDQAETQDHAKTCGAAQYATDWTGQRQQVKQCKLCGARIWWQTTHNGKSRPMDVVGAEASFDCHMDSGRCSARGKSGETYDADWAKTARVDTRASARGYEPWLVVLGLSWPTTLAEVTSAFRALAKQHHPDRGGDEAEFIRVREAYSNLKEVLAG